MFLAKLFVVLSIMVSFGVFMPIVRLFVTLDSVHRISQWLCLVGLKVMGGKITCLRPPQDLGTSAMYLCNHASYLDVMVIMSQIRGSFVTSVEIQQMAGLGILCKLADCSFTERRSIWNLPAEVRRLTQKLDKGYNVILFPEGTTTPGTYVRPFKSSLIEGAACGRKKIVPVVINYTQVNGRKPLLEDRDYICWYGIMDFMPHLIRLATLQSFHIEISFLDPISVEPKGDRRFKARLARDCIVAEFKRICDPG